MVPIKSTMGWCKTCASLVAIEDPDDADRLLTELGIILSELKEGKSSCRWFRRKEPNDSLDFRTAEVKDAIMRLSFRKSAPRCLRCGSKEIRKAEFPSQHPGCGGTVSYERHGPEVRVAYDHSNPLLYDTEGSFLGTLKPTVEDLLEKQPNRLWDTGPSDYPPSTWLRSRMTVEEFEQEFPNYMDTPYLVEFMRLLQEGDQLWRFSSPPQQWAALAGRGGVALVRDGRLVAHIVTLLS
jgi:hypothetical protein